MDCGSCIYSKANIAEVSGPGLEVFRTTPKVEELILDRATQLKDEHLAPLGALKELKVLNIGGAKLTGAALQHLAGCKKLQKLDIAGMTLTAEQAGTLHTLFPELKSIHLGPGSLTKETLSVVGKFTWLETLNLVNNAELTDDMLAPLSGLTALQDAACHRLSQNSRHGPRRLYRAAANCATSISPTAQSRVTGAALPVIARMFPKLRQLEARA